MQGAVGEQGAECPLLSGTVSDGDKGGNAEPEQMGWN